MAGDRLTLSVMSTDIGTGQKYWHVEFVLYPEYHGKEATFEADPARFPDAILNRRPRPTQKDDSLSVCLSANVRIWIFYRWGR